VYDLIIRGGELIDGSGAPRRPADVAVVGERIVAIGNVSGEATRVLDAAGKVISPGFIDVHTHYDAQVFWDPALTPSPLHGVTTAFAGNCGFTIAPLADDDGADYLLRMLARVEGIPPDVLRASVPWSWRSTAEYLDAVDGNLGINVGFLVGHSALRRAVMGPRATAETASTDEIGAMRRLLRAGLDAGALGFSSSWARTHSDGDQNKVPSRLASPEELVALAAVAGEVEGTSLQLIPINSLVPFEARHLELLTEMSVAARRPLNWNSLFVGAATLERCRRKLDASDHAHSRGGKVVALTMPVNFGARLNFRTGFLYDAVEGWTDAMHAPFAERLERFRDPQSRRELGLAAKNEIHFKALTRWDNKIIFDTFAPENEAYRGRSVGEIATEQGRGAWDVLCDIVVADELRTTFGAHPPIETRDDWIAKAEFIRDGRAVIGASDAGAHLDTIADFAYATRFIALGVRTHRVLTLEEAVHQLTEVPSKLYGLRHRGRLAEGWYADFVVFDEETVDAGEVEMRYDLPCGAGRLHAESRGVDYVSVNGALIVDRGRLTGQRSGTLLRSGRDTATPSLD
jgi:N-acyl-D-aspartate/D-glutamate deacylase